MRTIMVTSIVAGDEALDADEELTGAYSPSWASAICSRPSDE